MQKSILLMRMKRPGFYGVIQTRGSVQPYNDSLLDEKQVASLRKRGFIVKIK